MLRKQLKSGTSKLKERFIKNYSILIKSCFKYLRKITIKVSFCYLDFFLVILCTLENEKRCRR